MRDLTKELMHKIFRACGLWPQEKDHEVCARIVEALRQMDLMHYREAHFELIKAAEMIMTEYGK